MRKGDDYLTKQANGTQTAIQSLTNGITEQNAALAQQIALDFEELLDTWHAQPERFDNALDAQIHRWYSKPPKVFPNKPYFSPSAANACPRELYMKATGAKRDIGERQPHQGRWTRIGTAIGDVIQRDLLFIEKHYEKQLGQAPQFTFEYNADGTPQFEDFAKLNKQIEHNGHTFHLYGTCDGIMKYISEDGEVLRVGLEIKSKQTSYSKTSYYSMKQPDDKHVKQCVTYSLMYDVDYYVILYVNASKKSWVLNDEDLSKGSDIRAFGLYITDDMRKEVLDYFTEVLDAINSGKPPKMSLSKYTFNNFKRACAESLTDDEMESLREWKERARKSNLKDFQKRQYLDAFTEIEAMWSESNGE